MSRVLIYSLYDENYIKNDLTYIYIYIILSSYFLHNFLWHTVLKQ